MIPKPRCRGPKSSQAGLVSRDNTCFFPGSQYSSGLPAAEHQGTHHLPRRVPTSPPRDPRGSLPDQGLFQKAQSPGGQVVLPPAASCQKHPPSLKCQRTAHSETVPHVSAALFVSQNKANAKQDNLSCRLPLYKLRIVLLTRGLCRAALKPQVQMFQKEGLCRLSGTCVVMNVPD